MEKMLVDFVKYNKNFSKIYETEKELGWEKITVVFELKDFKKDGYKELPEDCFIGIELEVNDVRNRKLLTDLYYNKDVFVDFIFVKVDPDNKKSIRKISNLRFISGISNLEFSKKKDHTHYRRSGIDHVIAKNLAKNDIAYVISISDILRKYDLWDKLFGRIQQNLKFLKKYRFPIIVGSFAEKVEELRSPFQITSLLRIFSIDEKYLSESISKVLEKVRKAKNPFVITKGFEILKLDGEDCTEPY